MLSINRYNLAVNRFLLVLGLLNCFVAPLLLLPVLLHWWPLKIFRESKSGAPSN